MKEFNDILERAHSGSEVFIRQVTQVTTGVLSSVVLYDCDDEPHLAHIIAGAVQWAHPLDYDVTQLAKLQGPQPLEQVLGATENVGSCEPSPRIDWDKTGTTWHTDTKAGRYSVRRMGKRQPLGKRQPFAAFLNNAHLAGIPESTSLEVVKRDVERRIIEARRIANMSASDARKALIG